MPSETEPKSKVMFFTDISRQHLSYCVCVFVLCLTDLLRENKLVTIGHILSLQLLQGLKTKGRKGEAELANSGKVLSNGLGGFLKPLRFFIRKNLYSKKNSNTASSVC